LYKILPFSLLPKKKVVMGLAEIWKADAQKAKKAGKAEKAEKAKKAKKADKPSTD
jgi:hypothetical protein